MANNPGSKKRARQAVKRNEHNASLRSMVRTYVKKVIAAIQSGDYDTAQAAYNAAVPKVDSMANKGIIKKNKAARWKSRLNTRVKALKA
ncbi:MAG: 30S ribosomal protein S20 [Pseudomonadales bacterium]|nr:30S ribosomal protein S20 [Pseudomonadales bacterium]MCP5213585.1 30S ribosomal protein S20 [Pseudomonadales bacterium]